MGSCRPARCARLMSSGSRSARSPSTSSAICCLSFRSGCSSFLVITEASGVQPALFLPPGSLRRRKGSLSSFPAAPTVRSFLTIHKDTLHTTLHSKYRHSVPALFRGGLSIDQKQCQILSCTDLLHGIFSAASRRSGQTQDHRVTCLLCQGKDLWLSARRSSSP